MKNARPIPTPASRRPPGAAGGRPGRLARAGLVALAAAAALSPAAAGPDLSLVTIATGPRSGVYYFAGGEICGMVNAHRWQTGIRCVADETGGSIDNLRALRTGAADFAIVQSDWQYSAVRGLGVFEGIGPDDRLRAVFSLYPEPVTVVAGPESGIARFGDLLGKRVDVGPPGSGRRATMEVVMEAMGWSDEDFAHLPEIDTDALPTALCEGEVDAAVFVIANPNLAIEEMMTSCDAALIPVEGPGIDRLVAEKPYYFHYAIPGGTYPNQPATVPVFALAATLVTSSRIQPGLVNELVAAVFADLDAFRALHPAFSELSVEGMLSDGLTAPFHGGALDYFAAEGLK